MKKYDVIVIGSGGGSKITRPAASLGLKVAIIEKGKLGGTCLNHGCIPSKMLIHPADVISHIRSAKKFDISVNQSLNVNFENLVSRVTATIEKDSNSIAPMYEKNPNIDLYPYHARFISNKVIEVNGEQLTADRIFIAVGAKAKIPQINGLNDVPYMTYKEALRNTTQPKSMIVLGGGYIAVELGYFYGALGTHVTFLLRSSFLRSEDKEIADEFTKSFTNQFESHLGIEFEKIETKNDKIIVHYKDKGETRSVEADSLLLASGVVPCTDDLGLENTEIQANEEGFIKVNEFLETAVPGVYAFGDVVGKHLFRHTANYEGEYLLQNVFLSETPVPIKMPPVPHAVFSNPQIGGVGYTEEELNQLGIPYVVGKNSYKSSAMGMALLSDVGLAKLLFHKETEVLIGAHIVGEEASNMIHMLIGFMKMKATLDDLLDTIYIHPALPEIVRNAARNAKRNFIELDQQ